MFCENIESQYIVMQEGTSEGTQIKYKKDGYWYKKDSRGKEGKISAFTGEIKSLLWLTIKLWWHIILGM